MASIFILHLTSTIIFLEQSPPGRGEPAVRSGFGVGVPAVWQQEVCGGISVAKS